MTTPLSVHVVRDRIDHLMAEHGARSLGHGTRRAYIIATEHRQALQIETHVRGSLTTDVAMERWKCLDAPEDVANPWLEANVWPATKRWMKRTRARSAFLPTGGSYSSGRVLTSEAVDVLAAWVPMELEWQKVAAELEEQP